MTRQLRSARFICSLLALFCFISMYVPVIAPRYPAVGYYMSNTSEYNFTGEYYLAKSYWCITDFVFANHGVVGRVILSLDQAMLVLWAFLNIRGETKYGLAAALINAAVVAVALIVMLRMSWACQWPVLVVTALNLIASVVVAAGLRAK